MFVHPLKICEQYGFIQSCSYKSKASNRPWTIQQKKVVVFGRLLSSKGSVFEILRQSVYQTRVFAYSDGYCRLYLLEIEGESVIFL